MTGELSAAIYGPTVWILTLIGLAFVAVYFAALGFLWLFDQACRLYRRIGGRR